MTVFIILSFSSCHQDENSLSIQNVETKTRDIDIKVDMSNFETSLRENNLKIQKFVNSNMVLSAKNADSNTDLEVLEILSPIVNETKILLFNLGITEHDIISEFGSINDPRIALIGLMLLQTKYDYEKTIFLNSSINIYSKKGVADCFLESTGIAAGISLVNALSAKVVDKILVKTLVKATIKTIGKRALGGIGVALIIAEFTYCMLSENYVVNVETIKCDELVGIKLKSRISIFNSETYYITRKELDPITKINDSKQYDIYKIFTENNGCSVQKLKYKIYGSEFDPSTISDIYIPIRKL
ncbi:MAG: hypothetical protein Q4G08_10970 [Capnocytophaga sp.]|nr:hypothetical protein [Capnocytophaga sp.]